MAEPMKTIQVALPVPFRKTFTYSVPEAMGPSVLVGCRVLVPFRRKKIVGVVTACNEVNPEAQGFEIKPISEILAGGVAISEPMFALCNWIAEYYFAPLGEVLRAACPPALTTFSQQLVQLTQKGQRRLQIEKERRQSARLFAHQKEESPELQVLRWIAGKAEANLRTLRTKKQDFLWDSVVNSLLESGEIEVKSFSSRRVLTGKKETVVSLCGEHTAVEPRRLSENQQRVIDHLRCEGRPIALREIVATLRASSSTIRSLQKKKLVKIEQTLLNRTPMDLSRLAEGEGAQADRVELSSEQQSALCAIEQALQNGKFHPVLLFGVTASGKTEVYLRAIEKVLAGGGTAMLLVPEISLTPAAARTFATRFSRQVAILHSGLSDGERCDEWWRIKRGEARLVIGTRSAVFAPLEHLRLIVVDEEHEGSYKQQETPRYQGRDVAVMRAKMADAVVILGSATPSMESFSNAERGRYQLLSLKNRVEARALPRVSLVDMRKEFEETRKSEWLSRTLVAAIETRLTQEEQVLVLLNRRGFSSFVLCRSCGATRQCPNCSITLTYHKRRNILICHYCGAMAEVPQVCWQCESEHLYFVGSGTEQIEENLRSLFPMARVARLDRDTAQGRGSYHRILGEFGEGTTDILVGTQMIAKGHDFPRVTLVGVLNADGALAFPDFRSAERTFQLLTQVAGRAGRGETPGEVVVQAFYPDHYAIRFATEQNFEGFYQKEAHFRKMMHYPPFAQMALVGVRHRDFNEAMATSKALGDYLRRAAIPEVRVMGPAIAPLARLQQEYRWQLLLKSSHRGPLKRMVETCLRFCESKNLLEPNVLIDLDPTNLM